MKKVIPILIGSLALALSSNIWAGNTASNGSSASYDVAIQERGLDLYPKPPRRQLQKSQTGGPNGIDQPDLLQPK